MPEEKVDEKKIEVKTKYVPVSVEKYDPDDPVQLYMNPQMFDQLQRFGNMLASSELVPAHLRGQPGNCSLVAAQAFRWRMDPFNVAQATYVVSGKLGYEGKLIAAVINASSKLATTLNYEYKGEGLDRTVRVFATLKGEDKPREIIGTVKAWKQDRNPKWKEMPDQMLSYRGAREWARRHMPEAVLGVQSIDEVEEIAAVEAQKVLPEVLEGILTSKDVKATDDPPERGKKVVEVEAEVVEKKPDPKKKEKKHKVGDVLPNGKIIEELDDKGQPAVVRKPKPATGGPVEPEHKQMSKEDEDIDGLFS